MFRWTFHRLKIAPPKIHFLILYRHPLVSLPFWQASRRKKKKRMAFRLSTFRPLFSPPIQGFFFYTTVICLDPSPDTPVIRFIHVSSCTPTAYREKNGGKKCGYGRGNGEYFFSKFVFSKLFWAVTVHLSDHLFGLVYLSTSSINRARHPFFFSLHKEWCTSNLHRAVDEQVCNKIIKYDLRESFPLTTEKVQPV